MMNSALSSLATRHPKFPFASPHLRFPIPLLALVALLCAHSLALATTKRVCSTCTYTTIQAAVNDNWAPGDTILVSGGPYLEEVNLADHHGNDSSHPSVIRADGQVTIDGSEPYNTFNHPWTLVTATFVWYALFDNGNNPPSEAQVLVDAVPQLYDNRTSSFDTLPTGHYAYDGSASPRRIYVNIGGDNPGSHSTFISKRLNCIRTNYNSDNLNIEGFTAIRAQEMGIRVQGSATNPTDNVEHVTVSNCTAAYNDRKGIYFKFADNCLVTHCTAHHNASHGIYLFLSHDCQVTYNESYSNDDPTADRGGVNGIKVGDSGVTTDVANVNVDYNVVHDNEDTGIAVDGANNILVRRNVSYHNRDHGYDNNHTDHTSFINDVAANNDHDGISAENTSSNVAIYNCIFAYNARNGTTLAPTSTEPIAELWVDNALGGFASNHNVLFGYGPASWAVQNGYVLRGLADYNGTLHQTLAAYQTASQKDIPSWSSDPMFADTVNGNYVINNSSSEAVDRGKTDLTGWLSPWWLSADPRGFAPHDVAGVANLGSGTPAFADIGAFEFDPVPAAISDLNFDVDPVDCTKFWLSWTAPSDDVNLAASGPGTQYDMKSSSQSFSDWTPGAGTLGLAPAMAPTAQTWQVGVGFGQHRYFGIKTKDSNGQWSGPSSVVYISGPPAGWTDCSEGGGTFAGGGGGGDGFRARPAAGPASVESAGATGLAENTLLNGVAKGTPSTDLFRLPAITASGGNTYPVRIREASDHALALDRVRLLTVDHSSSVRTFMASGKPVLGTRVAPAQAEDATGRDITARVDGSTTNAFTGDSGAVITVNLATDRAGSPDPVVIEASGLGWSSSGILVQVPDEANGWRTVGRVQPRLYVDELAVDSIASARVRLFLLGRHQVRFVGRVARSTERPTLQWPQLLKAQDSSLGDALSALSAGDTAAVTLVGPDTLMLSFAAPAMAEGQVRECFLAVHGAPLLALGTPETPFRASGVESPPARFALRQNEPNPFSAATTIQFDLPAGAMARLEVFDIQGRLVKVVANHYFPAGFQAMQWDRRDEAGEAARPGVYLYRLAAGTFRAQRKMVLLP